MMETATLQEPPVGRSRFSKALPVPPQRLPPKLAARKELPAAPVVSELPLPTPPNEVEEGATAGILKALDSPLPPLPQEAGSPVSMAIPRRPIGGLLSPAEVSPVESLSSLISAYSNRSSDSTPRTSTGTSTGDISSTKDAAPVVPPKREGGVGQGVRSEEDEAATSILPASHDVARRQNDVYRTPAEESKALPPPPPPLKEGAPTAQPAQSQAGAGKTPSLMATLMNTAVSKPRQIWRRRSLKSDKTVEVTELKLAGSHGSTAASAREIPAVPGSSNNSESQTARPATREQTASSPVTSNTQVQIPPAKIVSLPGRNIRPSTTQSQSVVAEQIRKEEEIMGQHQSQPKPRRSKSKDDGRAVPSVSAQPPVVRLPTPDYDQNDSLSPVLDHYFSSASPVASPELPTAAANQTVQRRAVGQSSDRQVRQSKSSPTLASQAEIGNTTPLPPVPPAGTSRVLKGLPSNPAAGRAKVSQPSPFPSRTSSKADTEQSRPATRDRQQPVASPRTFKMSQTWESSASKTPAAHSRQHSRTGSVASVETLKPEKGSASSARFEESGEPEMTDNPGVALFPRNWYTPRTTDEMLDALPLQTGHFDCFTQHRQWLRSGQRYYPISCRACGYKDYMNDYWVCSHCSLRVCINCRNDLLRKYKGDLRRMVEDIERRKAASAGGPA